MSDDKTCPECGSYDRQGSSPTHVVGGVCSRCLSAALDECQLKLADATKALRSHQELIDDCHKLIDVLHYEPVCRTYTLYEDSVAHLNLKHVTLRTT